MFPLRSTSPTDQGATIPDWLRTMPKVELHVHLEGTISPSTVLRLMERHRLDMGFSTLADIAARYVFTDFPHFIDTFTTVSECVRTADDLALVAREYGEALARQNVMYAEIHVNLEPHLRKRGIDPVELFAALGSGRRELIQDQGIAVNWICDGIRDADTGPVSAEVTVDWMSRIGHESGIVALGLGGNEFGHPPDDFAGPFARARAEGFHVVAHAGEATGSSAVRRTIEVLRAERIGHGISAANDPDLLRLMADRGIGVELCPTSNLRTGVIPSIEEFPFPAFVDAGVPVSINSDDPPMFGTTLLDEFALIERTFEVRPTRMAGIVSSTIDQSFADPITRAAMHRRLAAWPDAPGPGQDVAIAAIRRA